MRESFPAVKLDFEGDGDPKAPPGDAPAMAYEEGKRRVFLRIKSLAEMDDRRLSRLIDDGEDENGG